MRGDFVFGTDSKRTYFLCQIASQIPHCLPSRLCVSLCPPPLISSCLSMGGFVRPSEIQNTDSFNSETKQTHSCETCSLSPFLKINFIFAKILAQQMYFNTEKRWTRINNYVVIKIMNWFDIVVLDKLFNVFCIFLYRKPSFFSWPLRFLYLYWISMWLEGFEMTFTNISKNMVNSS